MPSFGGFSSVRFKDALLQTKIKVDLNKVYDIITIEYNHPFCKILRPESILDIPVNDNGLKKKIMCYKLIPENFLVRPNVKTSDKKYLH